jgi:hypothetical protein
MNVKKHRVRGAPPVSCGRGMGSFSCSRGRECPPLAMTTVRNVICFDIVR